ncbi:IS30 family transposase [Rubinisphaera brasiliensis]|uniref:Integrase catalytic region n=1 Tax=Rubinisphaera brasiliensis (strain ATCC 49424 / DSM 5305 / JCM 21570 / IAM 15109 / NBRC 103401 / IFAM 1448) TaxID=756272 RepID=F0SR34_RUBBR|nr:IS30 family transposase [Rubinisphaera brasiliensis]ADY61281.1 Integrase catalytic region [Rubinisphaera brasiliensis DSM 5305]
MPYVHLTAEERETIARLNHDGISQAGIAAVLKRAPSTISRELTRNRDFRNQYSAITADRKARRRRRICRVSWKFDYGPLKTFVIEKLKCKWSPEQIAGQLARLFPDDCRMQVSHETIYAWLRSHRKHGGDVWKNLRQARKKRRKRYGTGPSRRSIPGRKPIEQRPVAAENRSRLGHWESDTIEGKKGTGYLVTHVERKTGYVVVGRLEDKQSETLNVGTRRAFENIPSPLIRTLTTDNGSEFSGHKQLEEALGCAIYFAAPRSPWQRGQNENTNGLLRQYFPKGSDFRKLEAVQIAKAVEELNQRPRKKYQFKSPHELLMPKIHALQT